MDIAGRHLTPDEALQVAKIRCEESFKITQRTDDVKDEYALKNNIPLLRINYRETEQESIQKTIEFIKS